MGRRKIEIKAIKDDRNRSVTFLKRKGGLFKKAHELSVLCSVDVAVFIFGSNKKLYEYSSCDMRELIARYTYHGGPTEHKGPSDFNGGADEDEDEDDNGTPPHSEPMDAHMLPPHFQGQPPFHPHMRHHTPSASPPIPNGVTFAQHAHAVQRGHTPQPQIGSRPASRNDMRRMGPNMMAQPVGPQSQQSPQLNGFAFVPQPAIYTPQNPSVTTMPPHMPPQMAPQMGPGPQYPYAPPQPHTHQMQPYMEDQRRSSMPPSFPPHGPPHGTPHGTPAQRHSVSPPQSHPQQLPQLSPQPMPHHSPPQPQHHQMSSPPQPPMIIEPPQQQQHQQQQQQQHQQQQHQQQQHQQQQQQQQQHHHQQQHQQHQQQHQQQQAPFPPPAPVEIKSESMVERIPQPSLLDTAVKKLPRQKQHSIFTPIDENRSILSQHLAAFHAEPMKMESNPGGNNRSQSLDGAGIPRGNSSAASSPPMTKRSDTAVSHPMAHGKGRNSVSSIPETSFTPPSRSNSLRVGGPRPRLKVQIPDEPSDDGSASATAESASPRGGHSTDATSQSTRRNTDSHGSSGMVLPPPSPSASVLLSAGATGPPNPFAPPPRHQNNNNNMDIGTPASALPSRFLHNELLPSPSSFYPEWNFRGSDSNTLPSPLNFATPVVGTGPSFLRDDGNAGSNPFNPNKRKSPDLGGHHGGPTSDPIDAGGEPKRVKVDS